MKLLTALISSAIALVPMSALAEIPLPKEAYRATALQFPKDSYCGTVFGNMRGYYKVNVKKGQRILVMSDHYYTVVINPLGLQSDFTADGLNGELWSTEFTTKHSGYYTIVTTHGEGFEDKPQFLAICAK